MICDILKKCVHDALLELSIAGADIHLEHPSDLSHGDYATNVAMTFRKSMNRDPRELAEEIVAHITRKKPPEIETVEVAGSGFINFRLSSAFFAGSVNEIVKAGDSWGRGDALAGKKVMVEYTDPNPFKEFHIGHLMSNAIGEAISRIVEFSGAEVRRANYQGDVGLHVAKAIWGLQKDNEMPDTIAVLGNAYARGASAYEEDNDAKAEIHAINRSIYARDNVAINKLYDTGRALSLSYFETLYQKLGTRFDNYFFESESGVFGMETVREHKDVFDSSEGAVVFRGDKHGLHTRVFINSEGLPTYEAKELGLAKLKHNTFPYDVSLVVTGNEITEYYKVVLKAMEFVFPDLAKKIRHVPHGMMRLSTGKMSSRTGDVISALSLLDDVRHAVFKRMKDADISDTERETTAGQIAVGAIKYSILKQSTGRDIVFDLERSLSLEGDSGPYLQYAYARARSILEKSGMTPAAVRPSRVSAVTDLERILYRFPEIVLRAQEEYEPHYLTTYLTLLAGAFNHYYAREKVLDGSPDEPYKLALVSACATTLKNGLFLLGISAPERM